MPGAARMYLTGVVAAGLIVLAAAALHWQSQNPIGSVICLALAVLASTLKIRLPYVQGTLTPAFVLLLATIAQLSLAETAVMAAVVGVVQVLWRPARPMLAQVLFNPACLALSAALAWVVSRIALEPWLNHSVVGVLLVSTLVLYGSNTLIVAAMMALEPQAAEQSLANLLLLVAPLLPGRGGRGRHHDGDQPDCGWPPSCWFCRSWVSCLSPIACSCRRPWPETRWRRHRRPPRPATKGPAISALNP